MDSAIGSDYRAECLLKARQLYKELVNGLLVPDEIPKTTGPLLSQVDCILSYLETAGATPEALETEGVKSSEQVLEVLELARMQIAHSLAINRARREYEVIAVGGPNLEPSERQSRARRIRRILGEEGVGVRVLDPDHTATEEDIAKLIADPNAPADGKFDAPQSQWAARHSEGKAARFGPGRRTA